MLNTVNLHGKKLKLFFGSVNRNRITDFYLSGIQMPGSYYLQGGKKTADKVSAIQITIRIMN